MGLAEKPHHQMERSLQVESEPKRWFIAGIALRNPLKPIRVANNSEDGAADECSSTTPTSEGSRIPRRLTCPPPPKKRKASKRSSSSTSSSCSYNGGGREFFNPPDLDTVFIRRLHT